MADKYRKKLDKLISDSNLTQEQKMLWKLFLHISSEEENEAVFEAADSRENLSLLTNHLVDKISNMSEANKEAWTKLLEDEEKFAQILDNL